MMDNAQSPTIAHWLSKISHFWPIRTIPPKKRNAIVQVPSEETQFARVALFSGNPFFWMDPPGEYEHILSVGKLFKWCTQLPGAHVGLNVTDIGLILRSIFDTRQKSPSLSEERLLNRVGAYKNEAPIWEADDARFGPYFDQLFQYINQVETPESYVWVDPKEIEWWLKATIESLTDYYVDNKSRSRYRDLLNRHHCMLFAPFNIDAFSEPLKRLLGVDSTNYQTLFSEINEAYDQIGLPFPLTAYWCWQLLDFYSVEGKLVNMPLLALWSDWPSNALWAPLRPATYETATPFSPDQAASFLEKVLWLGVETFFRKISIDCGLPWRDPVTTFDERRVYAPLFYFADSTTPPVNANDYVSKRRLDIHPFVETCLASRDTLSDQLAWSVLGGNVVAVRKEGGFTSLFLPLYLLLPVNSKSVMAGAIDREVDENLAGIVPGLAIQEFSIAVQVGEIDKTRRSISPHTALWSYTLDGGIGVVEKAIALFPLVGRLDRKQMSDALKNLHVALSRLQALIEQTNAEEDDMQLEFSNSVGKTKNDLWDITLSSLSGVRNLRDALLDSFPFHYLKEKLQELHSQMVILPSRSERISTSLNTVLTEVARDTSEHQERWTPRLGLLFTLLAFLIGLPTFIPQATLRSDTYPSWLERYLPLTRVEAGARGLAMVVALAALLTFILYTLAWLRQYWPGHQDKVQRLAALVKLAEDATWSIHDRNKLERLDEKAIQVLATIWAEHEQEPSKRGVRYWLQRPFRSAQTNDWLQEVRSVRNILYLFVLLPETIKTIPLPRTLCVLRYKMQISGLSLIWYQYFKESLRKIGFKDDDIDRLDNWLTEEKNKERIQQLTVRTFATIMKERGVTSALQQRITAKWNGPLDEEQKHFNQGEQLYEQRKYEEAITAYQEAIKLNPKDPNYYNTLGNAYYGQGKYEEAINAFKKAIQREPDFPLPHNNLANVYLLQDRLAEAKREYQQRLELRPDDALVANLSLGVILIHEGKNEAGSAHLHSVIEIYQEQANKQTVMSSIDYRGNYLLALIGLGDEQAVLDYQEILQSERYSSPESLKSDLFSAKLLASAPKPPPGIEQVVTALKVRCGS